METLTLEFENARTAQAVYGGDLKLLGELERRLEVRITARDGWIRVDGEKSAVERARDALEQLHAAVKRGITIHHQEFEHALEASKGPGSSPTTSPLAWALREQAKLILPWHLPSQLSNRRKSAA